MNQLNGAEALVRMLQLHGVEVIFGLCGDTSLPLYDALARLEKADRGSVNEPPEATTDDDLIGEKASPSLDVVQIEKKLQIISGWYEKGLITAEEAAAQRKALLDQLIEGSSQL